MVIDVDHEEPLEAFDAGARQVAALHDDGGVELADDFRRDADVGHAGKLQERRRREVGVDDRDVFAHFFERVGHRELGADRVAVGTRMRGEHEPPARAYRVDDPADLRTGRHQEVPPIAAR